MISLINDVIKPTIGELFSTDSPLMFNVPRYQREYTWAKRDWENLFDDISDNDKG